MSNPNPDTSHLIPFKPGQSGNPAGAKKGRRSLSTIIRDVLENEPNWSLLPIAEQEALAAKYAGRPLAEVIVYVSASKALGGDVKHSEFLRKAGWGDKLDITSKNEKIQAAVVVDLGAVQEANDKAEESDSFDEDEVIEGQASEEV